MTIASTLTRISYAGNGSTSVFAVPFKYLAEYENIVNLIDDSDQTQVVSNNGTQYILTDPGDSGTITVRTEDIPATDFTLLIVRRVAITQLTNYVENDPFPAESHERALDKLTMIIQELDATVEGDTLILPGQVTVQNNGVIITTRVEVLNFINFNITEPIDDQIDISIGVAKTKGTYNPGYSSYTFVSTTEFTVDLVNAISLFYVGRRLRFTNELGAFTFGVVATRDFNSTQANDTYISMTMDGVEEVPATINTVDLVSSDTQWSPISDDPFDGEAINDICIGIIAGVTYLFAVGDLGKCGVSINGGLSWTMLTSSTLEHFNVCTYDSVNETFWAGGNAGVLIKSIDGQAVIFDGTSIPALTGTATYNIIGFAYNSVEDALALVYHLSGVPQYETASSLDQGVIWTLRANVGIHSESSKTLKSRVQVGGATGLSLYVIRLSTATSIVGTSGVTDSSYTTGDTADSEPSAMGFFNDGDVEVRIYGCFNGNISGQAGWTVLDDVTFSNPIRDFAYSPLHQRLVIVGDSQQLGYWNKVDKASADAVVISENGFDPLANIMAVEWDENAGNFCAVADTGQICRSSNGTN